MRPLPHILPLLMLSFAACRGERAPQKTVHPAPTPQVTPVTPETPDAGTPEAAPARWGSPPRRLARGSVKRGTMRRDGDLVLFSVRGGEFSVPAGVEFGGCDEPAPPLGPPPELKDVTVEESAAWVRLEGDSEGALLRLSPYNAVLFTDDGCLRFADITPLLFRTAVQDPDPIFSIASVPDDAAELGEASGEFQPTTAPVSQTGPYLGTNRSATVTVGPTSASLKANGRPLLNVEYDPGHLANLQAAFTAYAREDAYWYTMAISGERNRGKRTIGREETVTWTRDAGPPRLIARETSVYGTTAPQGEDEASLLVRHIATGLGGLSVVSTRLTLSDARMVGAGRCPEMEGVLEYRFRDDHVVWNATTESGEAVLLGEALRKSTEASGCLNEAKREIARAKRKDFPTRPKPILRWTTDPAWNIPDPSIPSISGR